LPTRLLAHGLAPQDQLVEELGVAHQIAGEEIAGAEQGDQKLRGGWVLFEQ
jgi:hypothetical protein